MRTGFVLGDLNMHLREETGDADIFLSASTIGKQFQGMILCTQSNLYSPQLLRTVLSDKQS